MYKTLLLSSIILLTACSHVPPPPTVDGTDRDSINSEFVGKKLSDIATAPVIVTKEIKIIKPDFHAISVNFPLNGIKFKPTKEQNSKIKSFLNNPGRIEVRGRTDNKEPTSFDKKIALNRALSAKRFLIDNGIPSSIISVSYISAGDFIADNNSNYGRSKNRRVDIVVFKKF